jgi:hypothetical protein
VQRRWLIVTLLGGLAVALADVYLADARHCFDMANFAGADNGAAHWAACRRFDLTFLASLALMALSVVCLIVLWLRRLWARPEQP